ncbi:MAG: sigma-70 family RNA polymerase sigma factor [Planctomycetota bacterium]
MPPVDRDFQRFAEQGDLSAFTRVYEAMATRLLAAAVRLVRDAGEAEELVQQTFVAAIDSSSRYDAARPVEAWLAGILANLAKRRHRRPAGVLVPDLCDDKPGPAIAVADRELRDTIFERIDGLAEPYRSVAVLNLRNGLEPAEVAYALDRPPATVRSQLSRAKQMLRAALPAGTAVAALSGEATAGLAVVQSAVHAHAAAHAATLTTTLTATTGSTVSSLTKTAWIMMTGAKLAMTGLGVAACVAAFLWWNPPTEGDVATEPRLDPPTRSGSADSSTRSREGRGEPTAVEERVESQGLSGVAGSPPDPVAADLGDLVVRVIHGGTGLPSVVVELSKRGNPWAGVHRASTDPLGEAMLEDILAGSWWMRTTSDATPRYVEVLADGRAEIVVETGEPTWLQGLVVDDFGTAITGAEVWSLRQPGYGAAPLVLTETDAVGAFRVPTWSLSRLGAKHPEFWPADRIVRPSPGVEQRVQLTLRRGGAGVRGRVVERVGGRPIRGVFLSITDDPGRGIAQWPDGSAASLLGVRTVSSVDGAFEFEGLVPGPIRITVESPDHAQAVVVTELVAGQEQELRIELVAGTVVFGTVLDVDGDPATDVEVSEFDGPSLRPRSTWTDAKGRYELSGLGTGRCQLRAKSVEGVEVFEILELGEAGPVEWSPRLRAGTNSISGTLADQQGAALAGWTVVAKSGRFDVGLPAQVDADGSFEVGTFVSRGARTLRAHPPGDSPGPGSPETAAVQTWPGIEIGTRGLELVVNDDRMPTAWLRGRIDRSEVGKRIGAVFVRREDGSQRVARIERDDSFEIGPLAPGEVQLSLPGQPERTLGAFTLSPRGDHDVGLLHPERLGSIRLSFDVERPWQELRGKLRIQLIDLARGDRSSVPIWQNPLELRKPAGTYRLQIIDSAFEPLEADVDLVIDEVVEVVLDPEPCTLTTVRVEPAVAFESLGLLFVRVTQADSDRPILERQIPPLRSGWTCGLNLLPGAYRLMTEDSDGHSAVLDLTVDRDPFAAPRARYVTLR